jgi:hypothetical protein
LGVVDKTSRIIQLSCERGSLHLFQSIECLGSRWLDPPLHIWGAEKLPFRLDLGTGHQGVRKSWLNSGDATIGRNSRSRFTFAKVTGATAHRKA